MKSLTFPIWDPEKDVLVTDEKPLLSPHHPIVAKTMPWAYAINTAQGFFCMGNRSVTEVDVVNLPNGGTVEFRSTLSKQAFLCTDTSEEEYLFMHSELSDDVWVWATDYSDAFLIVTFLSTDQTIIIDSRGTPFLLPITGIKRYHRASVEMDKRRGCYVIEKEVIVNFRTQEEQAAYEAKTDAGKGTRINREFSAFCRRNAKNDSQYLYLTVGQTKCGSFVRYFVDNGMEYEVVPNLFDDDATLNIRIPLTGVNATREDVAFLCARYHDEYSIYNVPYTEVAGILEKNRKIEAQCHKMRIFFSSPFDERKETVSYYIINTLHSVIETQDEYEIFKATISKIMRLLWRTRSRGAMNCFTKLLLPHPAEVYDPHRVVIENQEYVDTLLHEKGFIDWEHLCRTRAEQAHVLCSDDFAVTQAYRALFDYSKQKYARVMKHYENHVVQEILDIYGSIGGWANEALLYELVRKEYPEAIFQYHADWLGNQSLDIFIPSLNTGIEYQGEQHYRPIAVFGGDAGYESLVNRDRRKRLLCQANGIRLLYWKYDEAITLAKLRGMLALEQ